MPIFFCLLPSPLYSGNHSVCQFTSIPPFLQNIYGDLPTRRSHHGSLRGHPWRLVFIHPCRGLEERAVGSGPCKPTGDNLTFLPSSRRLLATKTHLVLRCFDSDIVVTTSQTGLGSFSSVNVNITSHHKKNNIISEFS